MPAKRPTNRKRERAASRPWWSRLSMSELLEVKLCDLELSIEGTALGARVQQLYSELERSGLPFRPYVWLSTDWFTPDHHTGFAIPFFLAHPRLARLERQMMFEVEGGTHDWCMKVLRHETAHALDNAWRLRRKKRWRDVFGAASVPYRADYTPDPRSRHFVQHLDKWYSQSHPLEDFAETFAVWLKPGGRWRTLYQGWPAMKKLRFVDELMAELRGTAPVRTRDREDALPALRITMAEHYKQKRARYRVDLPSVHDDVLVRLFDGTRGRSHGSASGFLDDQRAALRRRVSSLTGQTPYVVDQVLNDLISRCRQLGLRLSRAPREAFVDAAIVLSSVSTTSMRRPHSAFIR